MNSGRIHKRDAAAKESCDRNPSTVAQTPNKIPHFTGRCDTARIKVSKAEVGTSWASGNTNTGKDASAAGSVITSLSPLLPACFRWAAATTLLSLLFITLGFDFVCLREGVGGTAGSLECASVSAALCLHAAMILAMIVSISTASLLDIVTMLDELRW